MVRTTSRGHKALWLSLGISLGLHLLAARFGLMPSIFSLLGSVGEKVQEFRDEGIQVLSLGSPSPPAASPELPPELSPDVLGDDVVVEFELVSAGLDPGDAESSTGGSAGPSIVAPVPTTVPWLKYPAEALEDRISGTVLLRLLVDSNGRVKDVEVLQGIRPDCDRAAVKAARGMLFKPALDRGQPVSAWTEYEVSFDLGKK
jgi:TonB family protein